MGIKRSIIATMPVSWEFKKKFKQFGIRSFAESERDTNLVYYGFDSGQKHVKYDKTGSPEGTRFVFYSITFYSGIILSSLSR